MGGTGVNDAQRQRGPGLKLSPTGGGEGTAARA